MYKTIYLYFLSIVEHRRYSSSDISSRTARYIHLLPSHQLNQKGREFLRVVTAQFVLQWIYLRDQRFHALDVARDILRKLKLKVKICKNSYLYTIYKYFISNIFICAY